MGRKMKRKIEKDKKLIKVKVVCFRRVKYRLKKKSLIDDEF